MRTPRLRRNVRRTLRLSEEQTPMAYRRIDRDPPEYEPEGDYLLPLWLRVVVLLATSVALALLLGLATEAVLG